MKRKNVRHQLCIFLSLLLIFYSALLPVSAVNLDESTHSTELTLPSSSSRSVPLDAYEGTFFVKNRGVEKFLQIKTNIFADPSVGTKMDLRQFDGDADQKWRFVHVGEGFYKIVPDSVPADSSLCIAVQEGKETTANQDLILDEYHYADGYMRKQWTITPVSDATYIIRPRCGLAAADDFIMAPSTGLLDFREDLQNRVRTGDMGYEDEWYLYYTVLDYWSMDVNQIAYWSYNPTIYKHSRYNANDFYFSESVACALEQWETALSISIDETYVESEADICCYGGLRGNFVDVLGRGIIEDQTILGITRDTVVPTSVAHTYWGDSPVYFFQLTNSETYLFYDIYDSIRNINCRKLIATHEIGHALGYLGHSTKRGHIMFGDDTKEDLEVENLNYTLTPEDILQLKQIYDVMR